MAATAEVRRDALAEAMQQAKVGDTELTDRVNATWAKSGQSVTRQYITMLRTGTRTRCSPELARKIARALGVKPRDLFVMPTRIRHKTVAERRKRPAHNEQDRERENATQ